VGGAVVARAGWRSALFVLALGPVLCFVLSLVLFHREGARRRPPGPPRRPSFDADLAGNRPAQLMIWGYVFHSWELLGMWAWTPAFLAAALAVHGTAPAQAAGFGASLSALFHVMGIVASAVGGSLSDRWGRTAVIAGMMLVSSACSFSFGWMLGGPLLLLVLVGSLYGFSPLGDSSVSSTGVTAAAEPERTGPP